MGRRHGTKGSTGGTRPRLHREAVNERAGSYEPDPSIVAMLRRTWARREILRDRERVMIHSFLQRVRVAPLSQAQWDTATSIAERVSKGSIAHEVGLLKALLTKRRALDPGEIAMVESMLRDAEGRPLTEPQRRWLDRVAKQVGAVYEEAEVYDVPGVCRVAGAPPVVKVERWGALPVKPPRRALPVG